MASVSMSRRTIALILAVALAALATIALISYIRSVEDTALKNQRVLDVFVAKQDIAAGVSGDTASQQGLIERAKVPAQVVPDGAITSLAQISGKLAAVQIFKDEIIVQQRFRLPGAAIAGLLPIPAGRQAISVSVSGAPAVGGFIQPGDQVSLIVSTADKVKGNAKGGDFVKYLLQNLDVLAVGSQVVSSGAPAPTNNQAQQQQQQNSQTGIITFAVTPAEAEQITFAVLNETIYFTLLPEKAPRATTSGRNVANLFS